MTGDDRRNLLGADALSDVIAQFPSFIAVYEGPALICVLANEAALAIVGGRPFVGLPLREALPEFESQNIVDLVERVYATATPAEAREWRVQLTPPGAAEPVEVFANFSAAPWRGPDGGLRGVITTGSVVTDMVRARMAADAQAAASERRYRQARAEAAELQQALLPAGLPVLPATDVAARYLVAATEQAAGGDWFDAVLADDDRLAVVVGDVVGHGIEASAAMGQLRAVLLELLATGTALPAALERLDAFAARSPAARAATVCVAVLDQRTGAVEYVTMGHPAPLIVTASGRATFLAPTGGTPLGIGGAGRPAVGTAHLDAGDCLVLYTDGLVERPGRTLNDSRDELARVASAAAANRMLPAGASVSVAERICDQTVEVLTRTGYADDVTVLAVERRPAAVRPLVLQVPPQAGQLAVVRQRLRGWLTDIGAGTDAVFDVQLAVTEVVTNAIEHANAADPSATVTLELELTERGRLRSRVRDAGRWREPATGAPTNRGRGLAIVRLVSESLEVDRGDEGTTVTFETSLSRPAAVGSPQRPDPRRTSVGDTLRITVAPGQETVLLVRGPVDIAGVDTFVAALTSASQGGTRSFVVDLTEAEPLASVGVRAIYDARADNAGLQLRAAPGSAARFVLDLVGLGDGLSDHLGDAVTQGHGHPTSGPFAP